MIEALKSDEIVHRMGGKFKLCALVQHRWVELINGARLVGAPGEKRSGSDH